MDEEPDDLESVIDRYTKEQLTFRSKHKRLLQMDRQLISESKRLIKESRELLKSLPKTVGPPDEDDDEDRSKGGK